jgi:hypothetical protein
VTDKFLKLARFDNFLLIPLSVTRCSLSANGRFVPCVDGSGLAREIFTYAGLVGAAMWSDMAPLQLTANNHLTSGINSVHLENRLGDVEPDCRDRLHG